MFFLFSLSMLVSCSSLTIPEYKKKYSPSTKIMSKQNYINTYRLLRDQIAKCYPIGVNTGISQEVIDTLDEQNKKAVVYYVIKSSTLPDNILYYTETSAEGDENSEILVYAKGDFFRTKKEFIQNITEWLKGNLDRCKN